MLHRLHFKIFFHSCFRISVGVSFCKNDICTRKHRHNFGIGICVFPNQIQLAVNMRDQILHRLVNFGLSIAALNVQMFTIGVKFCVFNSLYQSFAGFSFILGCFFLLAADNILSTLGHLADIPLFDIFADLHGCFQ